MNDIIILYRYNTVFYDVNISCVFLDCVCSFCGLDARPLGEPWDWRVALGGFSLVQRVDQRVDQRVSMWWAFNNVVSQEQGQGSDQRWWAHGSSWQDGDTDCSSLYLGAWPRNWAGRAEAVWSWRWSCGKLVVGRGWAACSVFVKLRGPEAKGQSPPSQQVIQDQLVFNY